jgi:hypothetical protein
MGMVIDVGRVTSVGGGGYRDRHCRELKIYALNNGILNVLGR